MGLKLLGNLIIFIFSNIILCEARQKTFYLKEENAYAVEIFCLTSESKLLTIAIFYLLFREKCTTSVFQGERFCMVFCVEKIKHSFTGIKEGKVCKAEQTSGSAFKRDLPYICSVIVNASINGALFFDALRINLYV